MGLFHRRRGLGLEPLSALHDEFLHAKPTVPAACITPVQPGWGRITHRGEWTTRCPSIQMPASAAKYYRLYVTTPGRFAGGNLPIKFELGSDPLGSMFLLAGTDPSTATLMRFGSSAERTLVPGNTYGLPVGSYLIEVMTSEPLDASGTNIHNLAVQLPAGSEQHRDVQIMGNTGLDGDGLSLAEFIDHHPDVSDVFDHDVPYLDWQHDGCDGHQYRNPDTNALPYGSTRLLERFESACMRHDFNWVNLSRLERDVDPSLGSWNQTAKDDSDDRLAADLGRVCYVAVGSHIIPDPTDHAQDYTKAMSACHFEADLVTVIVRPINNPGAS